MCKRILVFFILLFVVSSTGVSKATSKISNKNLSNSDLINKEEFLIKELSKRLNKIQNKYFEYRVMDFSNLEKNRYKAYEAYSLAASKGIKGEQLERLHLKYLETLHFELKQKLLTLEGKDALTYESIKNDFWQGVYEDVDWIVKNIDWGNVFKNITDCFKELDKDKCLDITGHITNLVLELVDKTWKRRFIVDMEKKINATPEIAAYLWDNIVMPKVDETRPQKIMSKIGEKINDKLKEKLQEKAESKLKSQLMSSIGKYRGLSGKELKEKLKKEAKSKADSLFASVVFGTDLLKKSIQIWFGEDLIREQLQTQKSLIALARMAANYDCRKRKHKDICDDLVNKYYFDRKALAKKLREIKAASSVPATPNIKGYVAPNSGGEGKVEGIVKTVNPGNTSKTTNKQGCKVDIEKYKNALARIDNLFAGGSISFEEYKEASAKVYNELENQLSACYGNTISGKIGKKFGELSDWYKKRLLSYSNRCLSIKRELDGMFKSFNNGLIKYRKDGVALSKNIIIETKQIDEGFTPRDYAQLEQRKRHIEDMLEKLDNTIRECRKYVDDFVETYEKFVEANYKYFFEEGTFEPSGCLYEYEEPYSWGYKTKMEACNFNVNPLNIGNKISEAEDKTETYIVNSISERDGDKNSDSANTKNAYQRYLNSSVFSLVQKGVEKRRQINKVFADYLQSLVKVIDPEFIKKQKKHIRKDIKKLLYIDRDYRSGRINSTIFVTRWKIVASDIKRKYNKILYICELIKDSMPHEWEYSGHNENIKQLLAQLEKRAKIIKNISKNPLFSEIEITKIENSVYNSLWDRYSVRDWIYFIPKNKRKRMGPFLAIYLNSEGKYRALDCVCPDCYCCWNSRATFTYKFLNKYPQDIISARNKDMPIVIKKCETVNKLNKLLDSLDKRYDNNVYRQAEKVYKKLFIVDNSYRLGRLYKQNPFLKYPCGVALAVNRVENYSVKPVYINPNKDYYEIEINSTPLSRLKKLFNGSNFIKIYSTDPNLYIRTYRVSDKLKRFAKAVYVRVCPVIVYGSPQNEKTVGECENKPMIKVSSNYNFNYVYKMPIKRAVYRIEVSCVLKDRTSIVPRDCPVSIYWVSNTTDKDEEGEEEEGESSYGNYKKELSNRLSRENHIQNKTKSTGQKIRVIEHKNNNTIASTGYKPSKAIKNTPKPYNNCKESYRDYVEAYNRLTNLMSMGKGNTDEAKEAYRIYKKARQTYLSCKNSAKSNIAQKQTNLKDNFNKNKTIGVYLGCFRDGGDPNGLRGRDLYGATIFDDPNMTIEKCINYCKSRGFRYAGVQYSKQCFCGNSYGRYGRATNCNMRCSGNKSQICGGSWANTIYKIVSQNKTNKQGNKLIYNTAESGENFLNNNQSNNPYTYNNHRYLGCFKDRGDPYGLRGRDLAAFGFGSDKMTPALCMRECARRGYRYAGVQYSSQCFCGNNYGRYGQATNCNMQCSGDRSKICGGTWANSIYDVASLNVPRIHYGSRVELNTDRPGKDYKSFNLPYPDYRLCQNACNGDPKCKAWTYVKPYTIQGPYARCWLKDSVPQAVKRNCCISGIKLASSSNTKTFRYPTINGYRLDWCRKWAQDCGKGAADAFCKRIGFTKAISFEEDYDIGAKSPTYVIDDGKICNQSFCDGFKYITCEVKRSVAYTNNHKQVYVQPKSNKKLNCKNAYRRFVEAYNRVVKLMSAGKSNSPEAKRAYAEYKIARERYQSCKNREKSQTKHYNIYKCGVYQNKKDYITMHFPEYLSAKKRFINLTCSVYMLPRGSRIKAEWYYVTPNKDYPIAEKTVVVNRTSPEDKYVNFRIENYREWPVGVYRVRITLNGREVDVLSFKVR